MNPHGHPLPSVKQRNSHGSMMGRQQGGRMVPYRMCPDCGQGPHIAAHNVCQCLSKHRFYRCPQCTDTRITDIREGVFTCGLSHRYHICHTHKIPVMGQDNYKSCSCPVVKSNNEMAYQTVSPQSKGGARHQPLMGPPGTPDTNPWGTPFM
jgi:hypothetical protein